MTDNSATGIPEQIDKYKILGRLGSGGYGQIYLAKHVFFPNRLVAIKLLKSRFITSQEERASFLQEAHILDMVEDPNILPIIDVGFFENTPYIITEYIGNGSLRTLLESQTSRFLSVDRSLSILSEIGTALATIHQLSIVHGDLKPENILLREHGQALLSDFGSATYLGTRDFVNTHVVKGTVKYMSPEQFHGKICRQSDQYALGCIAYELFTGQHPFTANDVDTWEQKHETETPRPLREVNPDIEANIESAVLTALAKESGQRHTDVTKFIQQLHSTTGSAGIVIPKLELAPQHPPHVDTAPPIINWFLGIARGIAARLKVDKRSAGNLILNPGHHPPPYSEVPKHSTTGAAIPTVVQHLPAAINNFPAPTISTPQGQPHDHPPNLHELQLPDAFVQLLTPALKTKGFTTDEATVYHPWSNLPYKYTRLLRNKELIRCLLHIDDQFLQGMSYFDNLSVMLDAFEPGQFLLFFLDIPRLLPIQLRNLFESKMKGKVNYIAKSDLDNLQSLPLQIYSDQLADILKLEEMSLETAEVVIPDQPLDRQEKPVASASKATILSPDTLDLIMAVWKEGGNLCFSLRFGADLSSGDIDSQPIEGDPKAYFEKVHKYLNRLASNSGDVDANDVRKELENIGMGFYNDFFPRELKQLYWDRIHGKVRTWQLLLDSDASQIPWELIVPISYERNMPQHKFLCEQYQLGRWLAKKREAVPSLSQWISVTPLALVAYDPAELSGIATEKRLLQNLPGLEVSPVTPKHRDLEELLSSDTMRGCFGLHLSGDGKYDDSVKGCSFQLEDGILTENDLRRPENRVFGRIKPFVFLNFCESGKVGYSLTGIRGWITQFMECDACCIVATMWKASDEIAPDFSQTLYEQLLKGMPIGEAMQFARHHIMNRGDATWLCYALYGDPRAKIGSVENQSL